MAAMHLTSLVQNMSVDNTDDQTDSVSHDIPASKAACIVEFTNSPFAASLASHVRLLGVTGDHIQTLSPAEDATAWTNIGNLEQDVEDASYLLLDSNTKLFRSGGLLNNSYTNAASICDLSIAHSESKSDAALTEWMPLPPMKYPRHGHSSLIVHIHDTAHIVAIGGFDGKGNSLRKCEMLALDDMNRQHNKSDLQWNQEECFRLGQGVSDFGCTYDTVQDRLYICGGLDYQFNTLCDCAMYDAGSDKWISMPGLNYARHCNATQLLYDKKDPNVLMTIGGWTGEARTSVEVIDLRSSENKWQIHASDADAQKQNDYSALNYPHAATACVVKRSAVKNGAKQGSCVMDNVVMVCGHREGLFVETNFIEALEMRTKKWHTIARFNYAQDCNVNTNLVHAQQTAVPQDNSNIDIQGYKRHHRFANAFRYLAFV